MTETPAWLLDNHRQHRPTEILLPCTIGIGPVVRQSPTPAEGWYARIDVAVPTLDLEPIWQCDHVHPTEATAWLCAEDAAEQLTEEVLRARYH